MALRARTAKRAIGSALLAGAIALTFAACGGSSDPGSPEGISDSLRDAGFSVDTVKEVSVFQPEAETVLAVEGNDIPEGHIVGVEFHANSADAAAVRKQYENIDAPVEVVDGVVYSALEPVGAEDVEAVVAAAGP